MLSTIRVRRVNTIPDGGRLLLTGADDGRGRVLWIREDFLDDDTASQLGDALDGLNWPQSVALLRSFL